MPRPPRILLVIALALIFGLGAGLLHGNDGGVRGAIGNLSAPWLLVALIPAWRAGSAVRGALLGTLATAIALVGFYAGLTTTMYGHLGDVHGVLPSFEFVLGANLFWFVAGAVSGPLCGALAGFAGVRVSPVWLPTIAFALMVAEIAVVRAVDGATLPVLNIRWSAADARGYVGEALLGTVGLLTLAAQRLRPRSH